MDRMREHSPVIVEQALVVSHELIRVAILWHEMWHEGLEEASRLFFNDKNPEGMIATLEPLHEMLEAVNAFIFCLLDIAHDCGPGTDNCSRDIIRTNVWS
jgi:hypothetical protein